MAKATEKTRHWLKARLAKAAENAPVSRRSKRKGIPFSSRTARVPALRAKGYLTRKE